MSLRRGWPTVLSFSLLASAALGACDGGRAPTITEPDVAGAVVGKVRTLVADRLDGTSQRIYYLNRTDQPGQSLRLFFEGEPVLPTTNRLAVWGQRVPAGIQVSRFDGVEATGEVAVTESAIIGGTAKSRSVAFVIVDIGGGVNLTNDAANMKVLSPGTNFAKVYDQLSYGMMKLAGDVVGPLKYATSNCDDYDGLAQTVGNMITKQYQHYMFYMASRLNTCDWAGLGEEGSAKTPATVSWYNGYSDCTVLVQEVGHNLGWMHSSTLKCSGASFADNPTSCTSSEYGNKMPPMGMGCGMLTAQDLWYWGFLSSCNGVKVTSSATFNLMALENACNGIQTLQIPMIKTGRQIKPEQGSNQPAKNFYVELRGPTGLDTTVAKTPAVYVYAGDDIKATSKTNNWTWLLDMNPSTTAFDGLTAGQSFKDPDGNITITVNSVDATKAEVKVDVVGGAGASPTCIDGSMLAAPGPVDCASGTGTGTGGAGGSSSGTGGAGGSGGGTGAGGRAAGGTTGAGTGGAGTGGRASGGTTGTGGAATGGQGTGGVTGSGGAASGGSTSSSGGATGAGSGGMTSSSGGGTVIGSGGSTTPGSGGAPVTIGTGGSTGPHGSGGSGSPITGAPDVTGGCACSTGSANVASTPAALFSVVPLLGAVALLSRRRRRPRH